MEVSVMRNESSLVPELYFLIAKFLTAGPCKEAATVLKRELERLKILPQRIDWEGGKHNQTFQELEHQYPHITPEHLLKVCARIGPVLEKEIPPAVPGAISLLGVGRQSLLRTKEDVARRVRNMVSYFGRFGGKPFLDPPGCQITPNLVYVIQARETSGPLSCRERLPTKFYSKLQLYRHTLGHLSAVYCVLYDRTGKYIITGADDLLIKVWSSVDGRLLATFRGASAEIMDIAVNFDNTLLAAGSLDRILRVWCFQSMSPVAVLSGHSGMITSVNFCPISCNGVYYLVSTSRDGSVAFWSHTKKKNEKAVFQTKPIQYLEKMRPGQAQMMCASFSPGGAFMAAGSADHHVRVYTMLGDEGPRRVLEVEAHSDTVDSIQWAHSGLKFISGSKDGTANLWHFERQQWVNKTLLMTTRLCGEPEPEEDNSKIKLKVTMVSWDVSDQRVVTAVSNSTLKVWNAKSGELMRVLRGHKDEIFVLESHPIDPRIMLSAGHDGKLIIWDILNSESMACFENFIEGQGHGAVFDAKWSPDGTMLAATDSHGHLLMYGFGSGIEKLKMVPKELFFHTDYRPLIRDANHYVLDEQTQTAPHLMPPPFLVDVDGNPYPPALQRLVPGRENCRGEQLVPNIAVGAGGVQEVIEGLPERQEPRSNIDRLIEALAQRQNINAEGEVIGEEREENGGEAPIRQVASPRGSRSGLRRVGDVEGVRQSSGNWQRDNTTRWNKPILARSLHPAIREKQFLSIHAMADMELEMWRREMKRRPQPIVSCTTVQDNANNRIGNRRRNRGARHGYRTRATRGDEPEEEEFDNQDNRGETGSSASSNSSDLTAQEEDLSSDSSTSDSSSEYSDWIADHGLNLEPPKRSKRKPVQKRSVTPPSDSEKRRSRRPPKKVVAEPNETREVPESYCPSEWLTAIIPRKAPYYPQMGDEIVYFRQGHQFYLDAVRKKKLYELGPRCEPWKKIHIKAHELVKVVGIKYEIRPPRLCCLKLAVMDENGVLTGDNFTIKYHDMADVLDFLVLKQMFDTALARSWSEGDRFRCMIDDGWWMGQIQSMEPLDDDFPESFFMCFRVRWDNDEFERMSPWDLEPIDQDRLPVVVGGAAPVLPEEIQAILYQPHPEEWPMGDRDAACRRIIRGLDQVMSLAIAEPFVAPVDLNIYPTYAMVVEYPIDLATIKARFENHFYRRITSAQFDVRYLATNSERFNEPHSHIVKHGRIITDLCLRIIKETLEIDVHAVYHQLADTYCSSESDVDVEEAKNRPSTSKQKPRVRRKLRSEKVTDDWKVACRHLLETLWLCEDSVPFREPVDRLEHPDYHQIIDTPMDLRTVKEDLLGGNYETPLEFAKDMKLIFTNSRNYNTNKRSRIYSMTIRLSAMFEEHMHRIVLDWKSGRNNSPKTRSRGGTKRKIQLTNGSGPSKKKPARTNVSEDDDEEDDEQSDDEEEIFESTKEIVNTHTPGPSRITNGHSKASISKSRPSLKLRLYKSKASDDSDASDSDESESDSSGSVPLLRRTRKRKTVSSGSMDSDSGDNYTPGGGRGKSSLEHRAKNRNYKSLNKSKMKKPIVDEEEEEEEDDEESSEEDKQEEDDRLVRAETTEDDTEEEVINKSSTRSRKLLTNKIEIEEDERSSTSSKSTSKNGENSSSSNQGNSVSEHNQSDYEQVEGEQSQPTTDNRDSDSDNFQPVRSPRQRNSRTVIDDDVLVLQNSRRTGKRPRYNEESDGSNSQPVRNRRSVKRRDYAEESDDESLPEAGISVSSRGRVRKLTARARAYYDIESPN